MRVGIASMTVTETASPASLKTRVIPALRPTRPKVSAALIVCPLVPSAPSCDWLADHKKIQAPQRQGGNFPTDPKEGPTGSWASHAARAVPRQGQTSAQKRREL